MKTVAPLLLVLCAVPALAQLGTSGELLGRVTAEEAALRDVNVTVTSDALQGSRSALTSQQGRYRFAPLPPGEYQVHFELQGFAPVSKRVTVSLGITSKLDAELKPATLVEAVTVVSGAPHAAASPTVAANFLVEEIERLPVGRDLRSIVLLSPSANALGPRGSIAIAGAPSWDTLFVVNGTVVNEYLSGQPHAAMIDEAIQEVVLLTGSIPAEYGRFTGGVVSVVTKSGGNEYSGSLRDLLTNASWSERTPWPRQPASSDRINHVAEATFGGYFLKDRLWFFTAARAAETSVQAFTTLTNVPYQSTADEKRGEGKLTLNLGRHSLVGSILESALDETNVTNPRTTGRVFDLSALIPERSQPSRFTSLSSNNVFGDSWLIEGRYNQKKYALRGNGGRSADRIYGTLIIDRGIGASMHAPFGCGICGEDRRDSDTWALKVSHYASAPWGSHTLTGGVEEFQEGRVNAGTRSASEFNIGIGRVRIVGSTVYPVFDIGTLISWTPHFEGDVGSDLTTSSAWLNDQWELGARTVLNLGVRFDRNDSRDAAGRLMSDDSAWSPRISALYDVRRDGRHQLFAGYGRYGSKMLEGGGSSQQVGTFNQLAWRYGGPPINGATTPDDFLLTPAEALESLFGWFDSVGGVGNRSNLSLITNPMSSGDFHGELQSPTADELSIGYAARIAALQLRVDLTARDWRNFYATRVDTATGQRQDTLGNTLDIAWIVNDDDGTTRTYRAAQLQLSWNRGPFRAGSSYVWSKLRGNDDSEEGISTSAPRNLPLRLWYPEFLGYAQRRPIGYLRQDQRHRARVWLSHELGLGRLSAVTSLLHSYDSGSPYSAVADIDPIGRSTPYADPPSNPGYTFSQVTNAPFFFSSRGAFRTEDAHRTDVAVRLEVLKDRARFFATADVLNTFNRQAVVAPGTDVVTRLRGGASSGLAAFNPFTEKPVEGVHYRFSPLFGKPTGPESYQAPRTYRISLGVRF